MSDAEHKLHRQISAAVALKHSLREALGDDDETMRDISPDRRMFASEPPMPSLRAACHSSDLEYRLFILHSSLNGQPDNL